VKRDCYHVVLDDAVPGDDGGSAAHVGLRGSRALRSWLREATFVEIALAAFRDGEIKTTGTGITRILPPVSRLAAGGGHGEKKQRVLIKVGVCFERFLGLTSSGGEA
jgi:hypothetical protein